MLMFINCITKVLYERCFVITSCSFRSFRKGDWNIGMGFVSKEGGFQRVYEIQDIPNRALLERAMIVQTLRNFWKVESENTKQPLYLIEKLFLEMFFERKGLLSASWNRTRGRREFF